MPMTGDATAKKVTKWLKIGTLVSGSLGTILAPILIMYVEYAPKVRAARGEAGDGYETLSPAVNELREIQEKAVAWAIETDEDIEELKKRVVSQEDRIARLEKYIEELAAKRRLPKPRPRVVASTKATPMMDFDSDGVEDSEEPEDEYLAQKPQRIVPLGMDGAKKFKKARDKQKCLPSDPLCGAEGL